MWEDIFIYSDGNIYRKKDVTCGNGRVQIKAGSKAGYKMKTGYLSVSSNLKSQLVHRIIWEMHHGKIPDGMQIDHINHIRDDNRIENLRLVSNQENHKNISMQSNNTSGITGVYWHKAAKKWMASIKIDGKMRYLGLFSDINSAAKARLSAEKEHEFHDNHGIKI